MNADRRQGEGNNQDQLHQELLELRQRVQDLEVEAAQRQQTLQTLQASEELHRLTLEYVSDAVFITDDKGVFTFICSNCNVIFGYTAAEIAIIRNITTLFGKTIYQTDQLKSVGEIANIEHSIQDKFGQTRDLLINVKRVSIQAGKILFTCRDITDQKRDQNRLSQQNKLLYTLQEISIGLVSQFELDTLLKNIISQAVQLLGTTDGYLDLVDFETNELIPRVAVGSLADSLTFKVKPGEGMAGKIWETGHPMIINNYDNWESRVSSFPHAKISAIMGAPLISKGLVIGVLGLGYNYGSGKYFEDTDTRILSQFAQLATIAIENAQLFGQVQHELIERQQIEEQLINSDQHMRAILEAIPDLMFRLSREGIHLDFYARSKEQLFAHPESFLGKGVEETLPIEVAQIYQQTIEKTLASNEIQNFEYQLHLPDIGWQFFDARMVISGPEEVLCIVRDITERKQAELYLKQRNAELEALLEIASAVGTTLRLSEVLDVLLYYLTSLVPYTHAFVVLNRPDKLHLVAKSSTSQDLDAEALEHELNENIQWKARLIGFQPLLVADVREIDRWSKIKGLENVRTWMIVPLIQQERLLGTLHLYHEEIGFYTAEHIRRTAVVANQVATAIENTQLFAELERRVTERTAELKAEKDLTEMILKNVTDAIVFTDLDGRVIYANPAYEKLSGFTSEEVKGKVTPFAVMDESLLAEIREDMLEGLTWRGILPGKRKDGIVSDVQTTIAPGTNEHGEISHAVSVLQDVTEALKLEAMKQRFIADAAHDLKNPIAALVLRLSLLKQSPQALDRHIPIVEHQVQRLQYLVEDLLTVSRLDRGALELELYPLKLNSLVSQVINAQQPLAEEKGLHLKFETEHELPAVLADYEQMERVAVNLIANAINYTIHGEILVRTALETNQVVLTIQDTGMGIEANDLLHIFDRFYRGEQAKKTTEGTGLGLPIVKEIIELHHGKIGVESIVGEGTRFTIHLPALTKTYLG